MFPFINSAHQQNRRNSKDLAFAVWSLVCLKVVREHRQRTGRRGNEMPRDLFAKVDSLCSGESALAHIVQNGINGLPMPEELSAGILMNLVAELQADLWLKCTNSRGQFRNCLVLKTEPLQEQLVDLIPIAQSSDPVRASQLLTAYDVSFHDLFELASQAGYNLTVRLLHQNQAIPGSGFNQKYSVLKPLFERFSRSQAHRRPS
jgi:hypothetical protein